MVEDLGLAEVGTDEVYAAMDWLLDRQEAIEATLARRHLAAAANPAGTAYFDLTSAWMEGAHCPLAVRGYSRDGKKGLPQIEYGLLTDPAGRPVAVRVFAGNPKGIRIPDREMKAFEASHLRRHQFHGDWNYTIIGAPADDPTRPNNTRPGSYWASPKDSGHRTH